MQLINERVHGLMRESDVILQTEASVRGMLSSFQTTAGKALRSQQPQDDLDAAALSIPMISPSSAATQRFVKDALDRYSVSANKFDVYFFGSFLDSSLCNSILSGTLGKC